jgi:peptidoglycan hydrolase-like protein with peptidoglycan-binding domain
VTVEVNKSDVTIGLLLARFGDKPLPPPVTVNQPATQRVVAQAQDGAKLEIPENAAAVSGSVNVQMNSTVEAPSQAATKVVSTVWDITVSDQSGNKVEKFTKDAEIVLPYDEDDLKDQGVTEDTIVPSFFDESTGTWVTITNYTVDKVKNVVIARVDHLTRFAIVAAADVTPPDAPAGVKVASGGQGILLVSWTNPAKDFDHAKVYRSATKGELGEVVGSDVISGGLEDSGLQNGVTYYYTVRAVDPAGNESANTVQTGAVAVGSSVKPKALPAGQATKLEILRALTVGSEGSDVRALQELLLAEGVYPNGLITGFFGNLTREAVIRFQEKYAAEILTPGGLTRGNGVVGPATRKKANALLGGGGAGQPSALPPGQAVKVRILGNLQKGVTSDDVRTLQELLLNEGVYPEGLITGFFGELTKQAVIRFQEKYADEILAPAGLTSGTGYVGSATRAKINKLLE